MTGKDSFSSQFQLTPRPPCHRTTNSNIQLTQRWGVYLLWMLNLLILASIGTFFRFLGVTFGLGDIACVRSHATFNLGEVKE